MTLREKVGQIIMPDIQHVTPEEAKKYNLGSILNGGGSWPNNSKNSSVADWQKLSEDFYNASPVIKPEAINNPLFLPSSDAVLLAIWFNIPPINIGRVSSIGR